DKLLQVTGRKAHPVRSSYRPARAGRQPLTGQRPPVSYPVSHARRTPPLPCHHEERFPVRTAKHASKAASVELDCLQHLTTLANPHAPHVRNVGVPDSILRVDANAIGDATVEAGPQPPIRQTPVGADVEGRESVGVGL